MFYRVFPAVPGVGTAESGGPLHVPRFDQGGGRHDNPDHYGALYASRLPVAPVAERIKDLRARALTERPLSREGARLSLVAIDDSLLEPLVDLDDPRTLLERSLRPSAVATSIRDVTQPIALSVYRDGMAGLEWWSTIEASWINVTLFDDRVTGRLRVIGDPEPLTLDHPAVREAAEAVGVLLG